MSMITSVWASEVTVVLEMIYLLVSVPLIATSLCYCSVKDNLSRTFFFYIFLCVYIFKPWGMQMCSLHWSKRHLGETKIECLWLLGRGAERQWMTGGKRAQTVCPPTCHWTPLTAQCSRALEDEHGPSLIGSCSAPTTNQVAVSTLISVLEVLSP